MELRLTPPIDAFDDASQTLLQQLYAALQGLRCRVEPLVGHLLCSTPFVKLR